MLIFQYRLHNSHNLKKHRNRSLFSGMKQFILRNLSFKLCFGLHQTNIMYLLTIFTTHEDQIQPLWTASFLPVPKYVPIWLYIDLHRLNVLYYHILARIKLHSRPFWQEKSFLCPVDVKIISFPYSIPVYVLNTWTTTTFNNINKNINQLCPERPSCPINHLFNIFPYVYPFIFN